MASSFRNGNGHLSRVTMDLSSEATHLTDILKRLGDSSNCCESILIRYQAPCSVEDDHEAPLHYSDDNLASKSTSSTASSSSSIHGDSQRRRRRRQRQELDDQIWSILICIGKYAKNLKHLSVRFVGCSFPADALAWLLDRIDHIESLHLRLEMHGSFKLLGRALQRHPSLTQVWLDHCKPSPHDSLRKIRNDKSKRTSHNVVTLEPLLDGISRSKTINYLIFSHSIIATLDDGTSLSSSVEDDGKSSLSKSLWNAGASLVKFAQMPSLRKLSLERMVEISDGDLATFSEALQTSHYINVLSIRQCAVGPSTGHAMGRMLRHNKALRTLDCNMHWWDGISYDETITGEYVAKCWQTDVIPIVQGLQYNNSLKCLGLYCDNLGSNHPATVLAEYVSTTSKQLCQTVLDEIPKIMNAEESSNSVLEDLIVGHRSFGLTPEIEFHLKWNRAGRNYFYRYENATRYDWMDALLNHRDDLSVLYSLVSMDPTIFRK